jgi:hypothetical protein
MGKTSLRDSAVKGATRLVLGVLVDNVIAVKQIYVPHMFVRYR